MSKLIPVVVLVAGHQQLRTNLPSGEFRIEIQVGNPLPAISKGRLESPLDLEQALARMESLDPRQGRVVELRFFAGLSVREVAEVIGVSVRTVEAEWTAAKAWLRRELGKGARE